MATMTGRARASSIATTTPTKPMTALPVSAPRKARAGPSSPPTVSVSLPTPVRAALSATSHHSSLPADSLQCGRRLLLLAFAGLVNEIECHRRSLEPASPIINRPNGVGLRKLIYECLNEWVRHFAGPLCSVDEGENRRLFPFGASRY